MTYLYHVDDLGRFSKIEATGIDANELLSNVVLAKENLNLGAGWTKKLRTVRQTSKGNDIDATIILKYADDGTTPLAVKADIKADNKKIISESFENLDYLAKMHLRQRRTLPYSISLPLRLDFQQRKRQIY